MFICAVFKFDFDLLPLPAPSPVHTPMYINGGPDHSPLWNHYQAGDEAAKIVQTEYKVMVYPFQYKDCLLGYRNFHPKDKMVTH